MLLIRTEEARRRGSAHRVFAAAVGLALVALVASAGCLGDVSIERLDSRPDAGQRIDLLAPRCIPGAVQCNGSWVERCVPSGSNEPPRWTKIEDCFSESLCVEPGNCLPPTCKAREVRCAGAAPQRCRADRTGWEELTACESAAHCSLDVPACNAAGGDAPCCLDVPCEPGELRCNSHELQRCRADQSDLDLVASCATAALCAASIDNCLGDAGACECVAAGCEPGQTRCEGNTLRRCNAEQTGFEFVEACSSPELCELGRSRLPLSCQPSACAAGAFDCTAEGVLRSCKPDRTGFDDVRPCPGGPAFCNVAQGVCTPAPCEPGQRACDGADVVACRENQTGFDPTGLSCATADLCSTDGSGVVSCLPPACPVDAVRCAGSQLQRCNAGRTDFESDGPACPRDDLCSAEREGCDFCVPSRRECTFDLRFSRTCAADGDSFGPSTSCPLGCIANTGACQTCNVGSYVCQNGFLSRCDDGFSFAPLFRGSDCSGSTRVTCNGGSVQSTSCGVLGCNPSRNACNECTGQARLCSAADAFRTCQPDGTFGASTDCQDGLVCTGQGQCVCTPNSASCDGAELLVCNQAGNAIVAGARCSGPGGNVLRTCVDGDVVTNTCASGTLCSAASGAECPACTSGQASCSQAGQPLDCLAGQLVARGPCGDGLACEGSGLCRCAAGALRCANDELLVCNTARTGFTPAPACDGASLRTCAGGELSQTECDDADACAAAVGGVCGSG
jgi:hypothetical protein